MEDNSRNQKNYPFIKNRYYPGKLLHAADFVREQEYGNRKLEFANRKLHGCGIIDGLKVQEGQAGDFYVTAGSALDAAGKFLVLPEDTKIDFGSLEGAAGQDNRAFVLGIRYAEQAVESERSFFEGKAEYQASKLAEGTVFQAYSLQDWQRLKEEAGREEESLTEERLLYQDEEITLALRVPKLVPSDSIFRLRVRAWAAGGDSAGIGWRGTAKLQGAFFCESGSDCMVLEEKQTMFSGKLQWEWEICTEEGRNVPVLLEMGPLELFLQGKAAGKTETLQVCIKTAASYAAAAKKYLRDKGKPEPAQPWLPLACFRPEVHPDGGKGFRILTDHDVRILAFWPQEEAILQQAAEENGIVDIRWRSLLKRLPVQPVPGPPQPYIPPAPQPEAPVPVPFPPERLSELIAEDRGERIRRGVAIIPVPKRYRRGQVLLSEEISHGFSGEEVFLWCGRLREDEGHVYWEHDKRQYSVIHGEEGLFSGTRGGWEIEKQALRQNVAAGTFQIALTLAKGRRRNRVKEVAVSWIAVRSV